MRRCIGLLLAFVALAAAPLQASDKEGRKLDKELRKISLAAADPDGRRVVNRVMAQHLGVSRKQLVEERRKTDFPYGQIFAAHEVTKAMGSTFDEVARRMQTLSLLEISQKNGVEIKPILASSKKLNKKIESELDRVYGGEEPAEPDETAGDYDPGQDTLSVDTGSFSPQEIQQEEARMRGRGRPMEEGFPGSRGGGVGLGRGDPGPGLGSGRGMGGGPSGTPGGGRGRR